MRLLTIHNLAYLRAADGRAAGGDRRGRAAGGRRRGPRRRGAVGAGLEDPAHDQAERDGEQDEHDRDEPPQTSIALARRGCSPSRRDAPAPGAGRADSVRGGSTGAAWRLATSPAGAGLRGAGSAARSAAAPAAPTVSR